MKVFKIPLLTKPYSVRWRLIIFVIMAVLLVISISFTAVSGLNNTYNSLSNLRDRSLNQMFFSMTLGVKTTQISTYATRLSQTIRALEYKEAAEQLSKHILQVHILLDEIKKHTNEEESARFFHIIQPIEFLEKSVKELLQQSHQRHVNNTIILSKLNQGLLSIRHIKRLESSTTSNGLSQLLKIESLIEDATHSSFPPSSFLSIQSAFSFLPAFQHPLASQEWQNVEREFKQIIQQAKTLADVNLRIQFLTYQIDSLVKQIDQGYTRLAKEKVELVNNESEQIQTNLYKNIVSILIFALFTIILIVVLGLYIYRLFGERLYSITQALTRLSQGDKTIKVPQQQKRDEIGDLARAFDIFQQNVLKLDQTDALLKEKSELLQQTFWAMRDGFAIFDQKGILVSCNKEFVQIVEQGHPFASFQDIQQLVDLLVTGGAKVYGADQALTEAVLTEIRTKEEPLEILYNNFIFEWRISPLQDGGLVAFLIDRTQRKKLENDLAHSQKMRTIGHLTGGIAHDFNNFLAVIIGNLDLIDPTVLPEKQAKRIQRALKAAENSATLTQRLLAYARKQPLHPMSLDINQLLLDFSDFMKHSLPPAIKVRLDLTENLPFAYIDKNQLETALVNLLVNAKDALNGEGNIVIRTCQKLVQRTYWQEQMLQLSVIDEGCGMDETTKKQIFEPFFTTKQNGKGSGLGLSMVYGFIRQSKGRVIVESSPGKGTTIHLQLPIAQENSQKITALLAPQEKKMNFANLLLVEDQQALRETLTEQLSEMGYRTVAVASAEAAMDYLNQKQPIDYLLSDVVLSGQLTGVDLANYVKQSYPQTKILLMTANFAEDIEKSTEFSVLSKPFHVDKLALLLSKL